MSKESLKILVVRFSSIGDIVLTTPVVRILKKQLNAEIHFAVKSQFQSVINENPNVKKVWSLQEDQNLRHYANELKNEDFDYIIDLHHNIRSITLSKLLNVKTYRFNKINIQKWLMVNLKWNLLPDKHIVERYAETVAPLGVKLDGLGLDFYINEANEVSPENWIGRKEHPYAIFAVGAAHATKQVPLSQAIPMLDHLSTPVILVGGPSDIECAQAIEKETCNHIRNACGQLNIQQTASLVRQSNWVMSPDTGVMHIAAAFQKPLVVYWGNTVEDFGMYPYFGDREGHYKSVEVFGLPCRPCSKIGYEQCPKGHFKCMRKWNPMQIAEEIEQFGSSV